LLTQQITENCFFQIQGSVSDNATIPVQVMPDDHSKSVPPLPIPNRTVKRLCADDSAATSVKVGYRQANYYAEPVQLILGGLFAFVALPCHPSPHDDLRHNAAVV
jgi:hypothetical protein